MIFNLDNSIIVQFFTCDPLLMFNQAGTAIHIFHCTEKPTILKFIFTFPIKYSCQSFGKPGTCVPICADRPGDLGILFHSGSLRYRQYDSQHLVRDHQLSYRIAALPPQPLLCSCLCRQRCGAYCSVAPGGGYQLPVCDHLLCDVSGQ